MMHPPMEDERRGFRVVSMVKIDHNIVYTIDCLDRFTTVPSFQLTISLFTPTNIITNIRFAVSLANPAKKCLSQTPSDVANIDDVNILLVPESITSTITASSTTITSASTMNNVYCDKSRHVRNLCEVFLRSTWGFGCGISLFKAGLTGVR